MAGVAMPKAKLALTFELWAVRLFETMQRLPEVRELEECGFDFAELALWQGYAQFGAVLMPVRPRWRGAFGTGANGTGAGQCGGRASKQQPRQKKRAC